MVSCGCLLCIHMVGGCRLPNTGKTGREFRLIIFRHIVFSVKAGESQRMWDMELSVGRTSYACGGDIGNACCNRRHHARGHILSFMQMFARASSRTTDSIGTNGSCTKGLEL